MVRAKKGLFNKTLERCRSIGSSRNPKGCMTVYVGPDKERYVVRTGCLNHPLFCELLHEAETEYGYARDGPIELPCDVGRFDRVMWEMDEDAAAEAAAGSSPTYLCSLPASPSRTFGKGQAGYRALNPLPTSRVVIAAGRMSVG